jgi:hypothetical protein
MTLLVSRLCFLVFWVPLAHRKLMPEMVWKWPILDVGRVVGATIALLIAARWLLPLDASRLASGLEVGLVFLLALIVGWVSAEKSATRLFRSSQEHA